ncbi:hypothetical protein SAMN02982929_04325 [Saccharopolyspora kobensis]|uniref:Uncharacterized protein n=1 Tax=Saccharopolyspora kobensis TaxID=146035 RepID=A0A1H6DEJ6_9PSEU|nr:hypothetical protein [Saccharopolyspora kobensis]SEG83808.1 hypothetical protein SAMN02982929_04325 [Saccharopolyspora kobensis]SFE33699.1 hypothetical protein SAMN05216506_110242 [Saccharopolyspora kobensis]
MAQPIPEAIPQRAEVVLGEQGRERAQHRLHRRHGPAELAAAQRHLGEQVLPAVGAAGQQQRLQVAGVVDVQPVRPALGVEEPDLGIGGTAAQRHQLAVTAAVRGVEDPELAEQPPLVRGRGSVRERGRWIPERVEQVGQVELAGHRWVGGAPLDGEGLEPRHGGQQRLVQRDLVPVRDGRQHAARVRAFRVGPAQIPVLDLHLGARFQAVRHPHQALLDVQQFQPILPVDRMRRWFRRTAPESGSRSCSAVQFK